MNVTILGGGEPRRHLPGDEAELASVTRCRERVVVHAEPAHERERGEAIGLRHDLAEERRGIGAARGNEDPHAGTETSDGIGERGPLEGA